MHLRILITTLLSVCFLTGSSQNVIELYPDSIGAPFSSPVYDFDIDTTNGTIWVLAAGVGVAKYDWSQWETFTLSGFNLIYGFRHIRIDYLHDEVWATTDHDALSYSNGLWQKHSFVIYDSLNEPIDGFWYSWFPIEINNDAVWIGTSCGIIKYDHVNWEFYSPQSYLPNFCQNILGTGFNPSDIDFWNNATWVVDYPNDSFYLWNDSIWTQRLSPAFNIFQAEFNSMGDLWLSNGECSDSCYVAKIDSNNQITYYRDSVYSGTADYFDVSHMKIDQQDRVWVTGGGFVSYFDSIWHPYVYPGSSFGDIRFDGWGNTWVSVSHWGPGKSSTPIFLIFNPNGVQLPALTSSGKINSSKQVSLYPNPSSGKINIDGLHEGDWKITFYDLTGSEISRNHVTSKGGIIELEVSSGFYVVKISNATESYTRKLVVY